MKVLAVDDDSSIRNLLPLILAKAGVKDVEVAGSSQQALKMIEIQSNPFECFLLDIQMPGKSGIELCSAIRKFPVYQKTPIIMITAMHDRSFIDDAFAAGATDYTTKPFDICEVRARVRMANFLVDEQHRVQELSGEPVHPENLSDDKREVGFSRAVDVSGLKGLISKQAFRNYLTQLSRPGFQSSALFAVHIHGCLQIYNKCSASEFEYAIRHVADAILSTHGLGMVVMCYAGSGNFICSSNAVGMNTVEWIEANIQNVIDDKNLTYDDGSPLDVELAVGATIKPFLGQPWQFEALETQAVRRAMVRLEERSTAPKPPNVRCHLV